MIKETLEAYSKELYGDEYKLSRDEHQALNNLILSLLQKVREGVGEEKSTDTSEMSEEEAEKVAMYEAGFNACRESFIKNINEMIK